MTITYSLVDKKVLPEIVRLNESIFRGMYQSEPYSLAQYQERLSSLNPLMYVAKQGEVIVGNAISYEKNNSLYLWIIGVSSEYRSNGIASKLLDLTETRAREEKYQSVTTKVYNVSTAMLRLLLKRGYLITNLEKSDSQHKFNAVSLELIFS